MRRFVTPARLPLAMAFATVALVVFACGWDDGIDERSGAAAAASTVARSIAASATGARAPTDPSPARPFGWALGDAAGPPSAGAAVRRGDRTFVRGAALERRVTQGAATPGASATVARSTAPAGR